MNQNAQEKQENYDQNCCFELDRVPLSPLQVYEDLVLDVLILFVSQPPCAEIEFLSHGELVMIVVDVFGVP